mgnify:CR=1 FL=1
MLHSNYAFSECFIRLLLIKTSSANIFADKTKTHGIPTYLLAWWLYIGSPILGNKKSWIKMMRDVNRETNQERMSSDYKSSDYIAYWNWNCYQI